ncbi:MAG: signal peptidase I [Patescibacteria group bacterium]
MEEKKTSNFWKELGKLLFLALIIVIPFRLYVAQPFIVDGASMDPTFRNGQYLIVDEVTYHFKAPERGSVLIFKYPLNPKKYYIKRVIGLPTEIISVKDGEVTIVNALNPEGIRLDEPYVKLEKKESLNYTLGQGEYFVMGDNRIASSDSRVWGPVPEQNIIGRPIIRFFPPAFFPGDDSGNDEVSSSENQ